MTIEIRCAVVQDVAAVTYCVCQAFIHYIPRIGKQPRPMLDDYQALVGQGDVWIAIQQADVLGVLVLSETDEGFVLKPFVFIRMPKGWASGGSCLRTRRSWRSKQATHRYICPHID